MLSKLLVLACALVLLNPAAQGRIQWRRIGTSWVSSMEGDSLEAAQIEVRYGPRRAVIDNVIEPLPFTIGDSLLVGLVGSRTSDHRYTFRFAARTGRIARHRLPRDLVHYFRDVSLAPDGRFLLYLAIDSVRHETAVVRAWPSGRLVLRSGSTPSCDCDVDRHHAHWVTRDSFELVTRVDTLRWERVSGSASGRRFHVDTILGEPQWHPGTLRSH